MHICTEHVCKYGGSTYLVDSVCSEGFDSTARAHITYVRVNRSDRCWSSMMTNTHHPLPIAHRPAPLDGDVDLDEVDPARRADGRLTEDTRASRKPNGLRIHSRHTQTGKRTTHYDTTVVRTLPYGPPRAQSSYCPLPPTPSMPLCLRAGGQGPNADTRRELRINTEFCRK